MEEAMRDPSEFKYAPTHEWVFRKEESLLVGITDHAQQQLSDIVHVELPEPDDHHYEVHEEVGSIESLRMATDFHAPVSGTIIAINTQLLSQPELINSDPYGEGWLIEMMPDRMDDLEDLVDVDEYEALWPDEEEAE